MPIRLPVIFLILLLCLPLPGVAGDSNAGYWEKLKNRLAHVSPQKKGSATTAVGGIRGAKDDSADTLYWKDEEKKIQVAEEEYARFTAACASAEAGNKEEAKNLFETFLKDYPQSPLGAEARLALQELQKP